MESTKTFITVIFSYSAKQKSFTTYADIFLILTSHSFTTMESKNMSAYVVKKFCLAEYEKMTVIKVLVLSKIQ